MTEVLRSLVVAAGFEQAAGLILYALLVIAFALAIVLQLAWRGVRRMVRRHRVRRELRLVHDAAYRERPWPRGPYAA